MMRKIFTLFAVVLIVASVFAQVPQKMSYQAVIRNSNKVLVTNQKINMMISILQGQTPVYVEMQTTTTNDNGLATIEIGNGTALSGVFSKIDWGNGEHYIKTETDPTGGTNYTIVGTSQLLSVPYALYATTTGSTTGGSGVTLDDSTISTTKGWSSFKINEELGLKANTSSLATVAISGKFSDLIGKPTTLAGYGITDGGSNAKKMSGDATMDTDGVVTISNNAITSPKIMDGSIGNVDLDKANIPLSGFGVPTAAISMGGFKLTNVATPTNNKDATNKKYVDDAILAGASPVLSLDASQNLSVKGGNSVSLADLYQSLSLAGTVLSISGPRDSHVDLAGILSGLGGSGSGTGTVIHDATLMGSGITASPLGISSQGITPLKLAGISTNGTSGQVLTSDGNGSFVWANAGSGSGSTGLTAITTFGGLTSTTSNGTANIGINDGALLLTKIAPIAAGTILGNNTTGYAYPTAIPASSLKSMLALTKSDVGLGNVQNVDQTNADNLTSGSISTARFANSTIPVSAIIGSGNAATYLRGDGTWGTISGGTGTQTAAQVTNNGIAGVTGTNVQATLEGLKTLIDTKTTAATSTDGPATHTKITYNANGLVTAGADATTSDIADSPNKRYVTDAQLTILGSISGINTGDQIASTVSVAAGDGISASNVQAALKELSGRITTASAGGMTSVVHDGTLSGDGISTSPLSVENKAITFQKMADLPINSLIGAVSAGTPQAITIGGGLSLSGSTLSANGGTPGSTGGDIALVNNGGANYLSLTGQTLTANPIDLSTSDAKGILKADKFPALTGDITNTAGSLATTLSPTGVAANTYKSVTVDAKGRVTAGTNPTTLAGFGITDAAPLVHNHALDGLSDVAITSKLAGNVLQWNGSNWVNTALATSNQPVNFTPDPSSEVTGSASGTTTLAPVLKIADGAVTNSKIASGIDGTKITGTLPNVTGINGITISSTPAFKLSDGTNNLTISGVASSVSGTNTGDQTAASVNLNPATISGISATAVTVQDALTDIGSKLTQNTTDIAKKIDANTDITPSPSTYRIVTYDKKGLVTGGMDATTDNISETANKKYITPAQLTVLGNTSGVNTGDVTLSGESYLSLSGQTITAKPIDLNTSNVTGTLPNSKLPTTISGITSINGMSISTNPTFKLSDGTNNLTISGANSSVSGANTGDQTLKLTGSTLTISGTNGNSVSIGTITDVKASSTGGLTSTVTSGVATIGLASNAISTLNMQGSSGALDKGTSGNILKSNGNGTFSWLDIQTGIPVDPSSIALPLSYLFIGNSLGKAEGHPTTDISVSDFGSATKTIQMGDGTTNNLISNLKDPVDPQDAATKNSVINYITSQKGATGGIVPLNATGTIDTQYLPSSLVGAVTFVGPIDLKNTTVPLPVESNKGNYYVCTTDGGVYNSEIYNTGDWIISNGSSWSRVANHNTVTSVLGQTGAVTFTTDKVAEGSTNLYYTDARVNSLIAGKQNVSNLKTDATLSSILNTEYPSVKAVKTYVDALIPSASGIANDWVLTVEGNSPKWKAPAGGGTVKNVSVTSYAGVTGTVDNTTIPTIPAITIMLGDITPTSVATGAINATTVTATGAIKGSNIGANSNIGDGASVGAGTTIGPGVSITSNASVSGLNTGDQTISFTPDVSGDVTAAMVSSKTSLTPKLTIVDKAVTPAKLNIAASPAPAIGSVLTYSTPTGFVWSSPATYTLPTAASGTLGGVKVGTGLTIDNSTGVLSTINNGTITSVTATTADGLIATTPSSGVANIGIATTGIPLTKLSAIPNLTILGNNSGGSASPTALNATVVKSILILDQVNNTSDANKPISTATQTALSLKQDVNNLSTKASFADDAASDSKYPSVLAIKTYVDTKTAAAGGGDMLLSGVQTVTGTKTFDNSTLAMKATGTNNGVTTISTLNASSTNYTISLPAEPGTVAMRSSSLSQFTKPATSAELAAIISDETGTGALVFANGPTLGTINATSLTTTGNISGGQLISTNTTGAPLVVNSATPVVGLNIGGTATNATNSTIINSTPASGNVYPTWVASSTTATNQPLSITSGSLYFTPSTGLLTATKFSGDGSLLTNLNATNLTSGTIPYLRYGAGTIPIAALNYTGGDGTKFLAGNGTWVTPSSGSGVSAFKYNYTSGTVASLTIEGGTNYTASVPVLTSANTTDAAGLMIQADRTKLSNIPIISGAPSATGQVLTFMGGSGQWIQPGLTYNGTTGAGTVSINNGSTSATIPLAVAPTTTPTVTAGSSGLMIPDDKAKLNSLPKVTNAPAPTQVLIANSDGTATWSAAPSGGGGGGARGYYYALDATSGLDNTDVIVRGTGSKLKIDLNASTFMITLTIPADALVDYVKINIGPSSFLTAIYADQDVYVVVKDLGGVWNQSAITMLLPQVNIWPLSGSKTIASSYAYENAAGLNFKVLSCTGGELKTNLDFIEVREGSNYSNGFAMLLQW